MAFAMTMTRYGPLTNPVLSDWGGLLLLGLSGRFEFDPGTRCNLRDDRPPGGKCKMISASNLKNGPQRFISPTLFVDGHVQRCDLTRAFKNNPNRPMEATKDWVWYKARNQ